MKDINKIILVIITVAIIIGWSIITSQVMKQSSIEAQKQMDIDLAEKKAAAEKEREDIRVSLLNACIEDWDTIYWEYIKLNWTDKWEWVYEAFNSHWDEAQNRKQNHIDTCFKKYK